ncbi:hypothetical protein SD81_025745 [Tolypothrix campylonemoides VB511288]|nr:hypothetical protein SD81_025745 [Tolypothrix campylonemoides VB511288]
MSRSCFFITQSTPGILQGIFDFYLEKSNKFRAYFPEGEVLGGSKKDFLALDEVSAQPWAGMAHCICVEGSLTPQAKALILERGLPDEDGYFHPLRLWTYELVTEDEVLLQVHDFSVWCVFATSSELQSLEKNGIPVNEWQEVNQKVAPDVVIRELNQNDLKQFTDAIEDVFLRDQ